MEVDQTSSSEYESASEHDDESEKPLQQLTDEERHLLERERRGKFQHGCMHYRRRCKLVAPCCGGIYWCRYVLS